MLASNARVAVHGEEITGLAGDVEVGDAEPVRVGLAGGAAGVGVT